MVGELRIGDQTRPTHTRFRNFTDFEAYINSIDEGYDAEGSIFYGYIYKINTSQIIRVNRPQFGNGCSFECKLIDYRGTHCLIPTKVYCFLKCNKFLSWIRL